MSNVKRIDRVENLADRQESRPQEDLNTLFEQLDPQQIEYFYQRYQLWQLQQHIDSLQAKTALLEQEVEANRQFMEQVRPSAIAQAAAAQLQACGVNDIDLLDRVLEHDDSWLDHTMQLLAQCERMDIINDYTEWCEHALDGAYDWLASMNEAEVFEEATEAPDTDPIYEETEQLLLQKLTSEEGDLPAGSDTPTLLPSEGEPALHDDASIEPVESAKIASKEVNETEAPLETSLDETVPEEAPRIEEEAETPSEEGAPVAIVEESIPLEDEVAATVIPEATESTPEAISEAEATTTEVPEIEEVSNPDEEVSEENDEVSNEKIGEELAEATLIASPPPTEEMVTVEEESSTSVQDEIAEETLSGEEEVGITDEETTTEPSESEETHLQAETSVTLTQEPVPETPALTIDKEITLQSPQAEEDLKLTGDEEIEKDEGDAETTTIETSSPEESEEREESSLEMVSNSEALVPSPEEEFVEPSLENQQTDVEHDPAKESETEEATPTQDERSETRTEKDETESSEDTIAIPRLPFVPPRDISASGFFITAEVDTMNIPTIAAQQTPSTEDEFARANTIPHLPALTDTSQAEEKTVQEIPTLILNTPAYERYGTEEPHYTTPEAYLEAPTLPENHAIRTQQEHIEHKSPVHAHPTQEVAYAKPQQPEVAQQPGFFQRLWARIRSWLGF
jgi:hypothetical protein